MDIRNYCRGFSTVWSGKCTPRLAGSQTCRSSFECISNDCRKGVCWEQARPIGSLCFITSDCEQPMLYCGLSNNGTVRTCQQRIGMDMKCPMTENDTDPSKDACYQPLICRDGTCRPNPAIRTVLAAWVIIVIVCCCVGVCCLVLPVLLCFLCGWACFSSRRTKVVVANTGPQPAPQGYMYAAPSAPYMPHPKQTSGVPDGQAYSGNIYPNIS
jgi:hypothetical protein